MEADELHFLEEMIESAELLDCLTCQEDTLHVHEEVISVASGVSEVVMRCTNCMSTRPHLVIDYGTCTWQFPVAASVQLPVTLKVTPQLALVKSLVQMLHLVIILPDSERSVH